MGGEGGQPPPFPFLKVSNQIQAASLDNSPSSTCLCFPTLFRSRLLLLLLIFDSRVPYFEPESGLLTVLSVIDLLLRPFMFFMFFLFLLPYVAFILMQSSAFPLVVDFSFLYLFSSRNEEKLVSIFSFLFFLPSSHPSWL